MFLNDLTTCFQYELQFRLKNTNSLKEKGWKQIFNTNSNQEKDGVAVQISQKRDFKIKIIRITKKDII